MKKLEKVPFIRMLDTLLNRRLSDAECTAFHASYEEFIFTRLRYPSIADPVSVEIPKSPLFLSEQFTPTDIMELATALQLSGAIRRIDGTRVDLATLVDVLSGTFNVRINNPEQCRHTLINRKLRLTHFLDILRNNLIAYSQR